MQRKTLFLYALGAGISIATGGLTGLAWYLFICAIFAIASHGFDGVAAFARGFKMGRQGSKSAEPVVVKVRRPRPDYLKRVK